MRVQEPVLAAVWAAVGVVDAGVAVVAVTAAGLGEALVVLLKPPLLLLHGVFMVPRWVGVANTGR